MRFTTINTDAGIKDGKAAVAYWMRSDNKWLTGSKALKTKTKDSNEAELIGIVVGLYYASKDDFMSKADMVVVNCDNQTALGIMRTNQRIPEYLKPYVDAIHKIIPRDKIKYKWVKGHSKNKEPRNWVNNWCDKEVRKHY